MAGLETRQGSGPTAGGIFSSSSETQHESPEAERPRDRPRQGADATRAIANLIEGREPDEKREEEPRDRLGERAETVLDGHSNERGEGDGDEGDEAPAPVQRPRKPRSVAELADVLGIEPAEVYDLDVPLGDGGTIKLGALKDAHAERGGFEAEMATRSETLNQREGAIRAGERRLAEVYDLARGAFPPELEQRIGRHLDQQHQETMAREGMALSRAMPEIGDEKFRGRFEQFLAGAGGEFGFTPAELRGNVDHRQFLVLKALMDARATISRLTAVKPKPKDKPGIAAPQGRGRPGDGAVARAKATGSQPDMVRAVSSIMRGGR